MQRRQRRRRRMRRDMLVARLAFPNAWLLCFALLSLSKAPTHHFFSYPTLPYPTLPYLALSIPTLRPIKRNKRATKRGQRERERLEKGTGCLSVLCVYITLLLLFAFQRVKTPRLGTPAGPARRSPITCCCPSKIILTGCGTLLLSSSISSPNVTFVLQLSSCCRVCCFCGCRRRRCCCCCYYSHRPSPSARPLHYYYHHHHHLCPLPPIRHPATTNT